jgi:hypothetical protein
VDVVRHDYPGVEFIELPFVFADENCTRDHVGDSGILQPERTAPLRVQRMVRGHESVSRCSVGDTNSLSRRQRAVGLEVRQSSSVFRHATGRRNRLPHRFRAVAHSNFSTKCKTCTTDKVFRA